MISSLLPPLCPIPMASLEGLQFSFCFRSVCYMAPPLELLSAVLLPDG